MYIEDFETFYLQAEELYRARPVETRYTIKYRHTDGALVLKVTDDRMCLKYKTDQQSDMKKLERLTTLFFTLMANGSIPEGSDVPMQEAQPQQSQQQPQSSQGQQSQGRGKKSGQRRKG